MGTFYEDLTELDIVIESGTDAAIASAQCASLIKDRINKIIMAGSAEEALALYEQAVKDFNAYGIEAWEAEINRQIQEKRDKMGN